MKISPVLYSLSLIMCLPVSAAGADTQAPPATEAAAAPIAEANENSVLEYLDQIAELEKLNGAYDPNLSEHLLGLGLLYLNREQYTEAAEVLNRSLHIRKVNDGIQSMTQVPVLRALITANTGARNWEELNQNYHLLLWVHQRNLKSGDPELLPVIIAVGNWKLEAYSRGLTENPPKLLNDLRYTFQTTVDVMEELYGKNDPRLLGPLKVLALANYQQIGEIANTPMDEFHSYGSRVSYQQRCTPIRRPDGTFMMVCGLVEVPNPNYFVSQQQNKELKINEQMHKVRSHLDRIAEINAANPDTSTEEKATALVNLGDWYFLSNKSKTALEHYQQAYVLLSASETDRELRDRLFSKPVRIPVMTTRLPMEQDISMDESTTPYVRLSFDVSVDGQARNIKIIAESDPNSYRVRSNAKDIIKSSIFRPRLLDGKLMATQATELLLSGAVLQSNVQQMYRRNDTRSVKRILR